MSGNSEVVPIKTNIYFSHFSDNFFHIFPYPNPNFGASWEEMGMNQRCFPFFTYLFSIFPTQISILRGSWEKMGLDPLISYTLFPSPNPNFDTFWEKIVLKPNQPSIHLCFVFHLCVWAQHTPMGCDISIISITISITISIIDVA